MGCKRRGIAALLAAVSLLWCLTGCGQILYGEKVELSGELSGKLTMTGSTSMTKVCQALGEAFQEKYPGVVTEKSGTGSGEARRRAERHGPAGGFVPRSAGGGTSRGI